MEEEVSAEPVVVDETAQESLEAAGVVAPEEVVETPTVAE